MYMYMHIFMHVQINYLCTCAQVITAELVQLVQYITFMSCVDVILLVLKLNLNTCSEGVNTYFDYQYIYLMLLMSTAVYTLRLIVSCISSTL